MAQAPLEPKIIEPVMLDPEPYGSPTAHDAMPQLEIEAGPDLDVDISTDDLGSDIEQKPELAPMHEFIPKTREIAKPVSAEPEITETLASDRPDLEGEQKTTTTLPKSDLERIAREAIEKAIWEIVPQLAETLLREEIEKLVNEKLAD
jgi:hypothetical protein